MKPASVILMVLLLMVLGGCRKPAEDISQTQFPQDLRTKVELARARDGKSGKVRVVHLTEDKTKIVGAEIEYPDGVTEFEYYREDGSLREISGFYPPADGNEKNRKPKRTVLFDADGKTVLFERINRADGSVEMLNRSRSDGGTETETFYEDGRTTRTRKIMTRYRDVVLEETYRASGKLETSTRKLNYSEYEVIEYRENGTRLSATIRGTSKWSPVEKIVFGHDGIMVEMKIRYTSYSVEVEYRRSDGTIAEKRNYSSYGSVTVTTYGADGKPQYRQEWRGSPPSGDWTDASNYKLRTIEELKPDGSVARDIELYDDGKTVKKLRIRDGVNYYSGTYKYFRPDGTLEKEEIKEDYNKVKESKEFQPEDDIRETVPDEYFRFSPRPRPKLLSQMPTAQPYQYGDPDYPYWDD